MRTFNFLIRTLCAAALILAPAWATSCDDDKEDVRKVEVTGVTLDKETLSLVIGTSGPLVATVLPENADNRDVKWTSADESVAAVNEFGQVTGVGVGNTTVTVTTIHNSQSATCTVYVTEDVVPVTRVVLDKNDIEIYEGQSEKLTASVAPVDATNRDISWKSNDPTVATVDQDGTVNGIGEGIATVTVTTEDGGFTAECEVTVLSSAIAVESVSVTPNSIGLKIGKTATLGYNVLPQDATNKNVNWSSSNTSVATVDEEGEVKAVGLGTAVITVTTESGGKTAACEVEVMDYEVYVAGYEGSSRSSVAYMWVNGVPTKLGEDGTNSKATSVFVDGDDVYIAGNLGMDVYYWKNGVENLVAEVSNPSIKDLYVNAGDVYIAGEIYDWGYKARYWKNGQIYEVSDQTSSASNSIWVSGSDVYVAGVEQTESYYGYLQIATVWKNGEVLYKLTDGGGEFDLSSNALDLYMDGDDIYVAGTETVPYTSNPEAKVWKNGELLYAYPISERGYSQVDAVEVFEGDVYVAGIHGDYSGCVVWKNGQVVYDIPDANSLDDICVVNGDVYVTGYANMSSGVNRAKVWKNGEELYELGTGFDGQNTAGLAIAVK